MECPACHAENRRERRYCGKCGATLPIHCRICGFCNEPDDAFCGACGKPLASPAAPTTPEPPETEDTDAEFQATRRHITVVFSDLVGSTDISERLDPEELAELLTRYRHACAEVVHRLDGFVAEYLGDGVLIYFGYPHAHDDDPQRAIRAGLGLVEAVEKLNSRVPDSRARLAVRIGINTGLVVAGDIRVGQHHDQKAIFGETPNIAARLQSLAEPGTVVIGSNTHRLVKGLVVCDPLGPQRLKGISEPVEAYRVREISDARSRFAISLRVGLPPLIGREEEMRLLLKRWQEARNDEGQVVLISSEPGTGKSRLLQSLQHEIEGEDCEIVHYTCSGYQQDVPFQPVIDQLVGTLGIVKCDSVDGSLDKLDAFLSKRGVLDAQYRPLLAGLLGLATGGRYPPLMLSPEDKKRKTLEALVSVALSPSPSTALLIVVEDLQWADPSTLEYIGLLIDRVHMARVLLVCAFRADFEAPWTHHPQATSIALKRLSRRDSIALVNQVTGGKSLPKEVVDQIVVRTDGVPLFVEELTKSVLESGLLVERGDRYELQGPLPKMAIPESLQDSLMARLDRLASAKQVAQLAATVGRTFSAELLAAVSRSAERGLEDAISRLVQAELIYRRGLPAEMLYEFKHALVQQAAYESLLHSKRRQLHKDIARCLEEQFPEIVEKAPELLAHHHREAGQPEQSISYAFKAGDAALGRYAATEARAFYKSALDMVESLPSSEQGARLRIHGTLKLANVASDRKQIERGLRDLDCARALAEKIDDRHLLCQIHYWIGRSNYVFGRFDAAVEHAERAMQFADAMGGGDEIVAGPVNLLARVHCLRGDPLKAIKYAAQSVRQMHDLGNFVEEASVSGVLAFGCAQNGRYAEALEAAQHGVELAQKLDHLPTAAACFMFRGVVHGWFGKTEPAVSDFEQAIAICERSGDLFRKYVSLGWLGEAYLVAGEDATAFDCLAQCLAIGDQLGTSFHRGGFEALMAKAHLRRANFGEALRTSESALSAAARSAEPWAESIALRVAAECWLAAEPPDLEKAEQSVRAAIKIQAERQCKCDLAWSHLVLGELLAAKRDFASARKAYDIAESLFNELMIQQGAKLTKQASASIYIDL